MKGKHRFLLLLLILLTVCHFGLPLAADAQPKPQIVLLQAVNPTTPATPITPDTPVTEGESGGTPTPATPSEETPDSNDDPDGGIFSGIISAIKGIGRWFSSLGDTITTGLSDLYEMTTGFLTGYIDQKWEEVKNNVFRAIMPLAGKGGLLEIIEKGGTQYVTPKLNTLINAVYEVFYLPGIVVMVICFCYSVSRSVYTLEIGGKHSIVQPIIGMIVTLFAFTMSKEIMTALFTLSINLTGKVVTAVGITPDVKLLGNVGYNILNSVVQLILMLNIAKITLMQSIAPFFIGFAPADNTRRIMFNLLKEYGKCCLVPPITGAYALIVICICDTTVGLLSAIVIGCSIFSVSSKLLDKLIN